MEFDVRLSASKVKPRLSGWTMSDISRLVVERSPNPWVTAAGDLDRLGGPTASRLEAVILTQTDCCDLDTGSCLCMMLEIVGRKGRWSTIVGSFTHL